MSTLTLEQANTIIGTALAEWSRGQRDGGRHETLAMPARPGILSALRPCVHQRYAGQPRVRRPRVRAGD